MRDSYDNPTSEPSGALAHFTLSEVVDPQVSDRLGIGPGTIREALAGAFDMKAHSVEHLYAMSNDIGLAATRAREGQSSLEGAVLTLFKPYQFMNAQKVDDPARYSRNWRANRSYSR